MIQTLIHTEACVEQATFAQELLRRTGAIPGVELAGVTSEICPVLQRSAVHTLRLKIRALTLHKSSPQS